MPRRRLIAAALAAIGLFSGVAMAQTPAKVYRVGLIGPGPLPQDASIEIGSLIGGLVKRGYAVVGNLTFERRGAPPEPILLRADVE